MATTETKIWQALKSRVNAITTTYSKDWQGSDFTPSDEPYIEIRHLPNYSNRVLIEDDGQHKYKGILQLSLMYPVSKKHTYEVMQEIAATIAATFVCGQVLTFQGVSVTIEKKPDIAQPFREEGFWKFPITIRYFSFS